MPSKGAGFLAECDPVDPAKCRIFLGGRAMSIAAGSRVSKRPDIQGGDACIDGTRIPVWVLLLNYRRLGGSDAELLASYPFS